MPDSPRRPINVMPWLELREAVTVGGVRLGTFEHIRDHLSNAEYQQAENLCRCFRTVQSWQAGEPQTAPAERPTLAVAIDGAPGNEKEAERMGERLSFACHIVGADALAAKPEWRAEVVQPYPLSVSEHDATNRFPLFDDLGNVTYTSTDYFLVVRPPWLMHLGQHFAPYGSYSPDLADKLGNLIERALRQSPREWKTLTSLQWFVQSHSYSLATLHLGDGPNLVALATAFEVLLEVPKGDKTEEIRKRVEQRTARVELGDFAADFYDKRNYVVHGSEKLRPMYGTDKHMRYLLFARVLFWFCVRAILEDEHQIAWLDQNAQGPRGYFRNFQPSRVDRADQLVEYLTSNRQRLTEIASLDPEQVEKQSEWQTRFVALLDGLYGKPFDVSASNNVIRSGLKTICSVLAKCLERFAHDQEPSIRNEIEQIAVRLAKLDDPQRGFMSRQFDELINEDWVLEASWAVRPVIYDRSISELLAPQSPIRLLAQRLQA